MLIMFQRNLRLTNDWLKPQLSFVFLGVFLRDGAHILKVPMFQIII